jgi:hypothetical protein
MSSYNVKIQFDSIENWIKCETMYLKNNPWNGIPCKKIPWKQLSLETTFFGSLEWHSLEKDFLAMSYYL